MKHYTRWLLIIALFGIISILATYFAFTKGYFILNWDGYIHLTRFENIYMSLKAGSLPPLVNLLGFGNVGHAFNSMYPWISSLILIIPRFLFENPIMALACGMCIVNFLTVINTYILMRELTDRLLLRILGSVLYVFSTYHFILLYTRIALGEALAYTFFPLVLAGCYRIWHQKYQYSYLEIGLGIGMIINSHLISATMIVIMIIGTEFVRLLTKKVTLIEFTCFVRAAIVALLVGLYSIVNVLFMEYNNQFFEIGRGMSKVLGMNMLTTAFNNTIDEQTSAFNIGIINLILLMCVAVICFKKKTKSSPYVYSSLIMLFIIFGWVPIDFLNNTFISNIQFLGRLLGIINLFVIMSVIIQMEEFKFNNNSMIIFLVIIGILFSTSSLYNYHQTYGVDKNSVLVRLDKENYINNTINRGMKLRDYVPKFVADDLFDNKYHSFKIKEQTYKKLKGEMFVRKEGVYKINFAICGGVPYEFKVNGKKVANKSIEGELKLKLNAGKNRISITTRLPRFCYITACITLITIVIIMIYLMGNFVKISRIRYS